MFSSCGGEESPSPMLMMQGRPRLRHRAVAIVNTKGCGGKQSCLCSLGRCWRWLMCPLGPVWALGGGVAALRLHAGQKDPWAYRERSLTHIVSASSLASGYFSDSVYSSWLCQSWWARMRLVRCCRSGTERWDGGIYLLLQALNWNTSHYCWHVVCVRVCF